eukprot:gb/GECG01005531.1/.p1 GENE.gb/GECG01005531.1/~~gb/GECG01005531.1/.p1  ORF type:complete len:927 (+),score=127.74 gb/GECG01005531.1/:1-2781(+)
MSSRNRTENMRTRRLKPEKKVPVVHSLEELEQFTDRNSAEEALQPDQKQQKNAPKISLPVPDVRRVEDYEQEHSPNFQLPQQYIHHKPRIYNEGFDAVDYVADDQDWNWFFNKASAAVDVDTSKLPISVMEVAIDTFEKLTYRKGNPVPMTEAEEHVFNRSDDIKRDVEMSRLLLAIHGYWGDKRRSLGKPLLRQFWPTTPLSDTNPHNVFRPREKEGYRLRKTRGRNEGGMETYRKLQMMREGFQQAQQLVDLVRRREIIKRELQRVTKDSFYQYIADTTGAEFEPRSLKKKDEVLQLANSENLGLALEGTDYLTRAKSNQSFPSQTPTPTSTHPSAHRRDPTVAALERALELPSLPRIEYSFSCGGWKLPENAPPVFWSIPKALAKRKDKELIVSPAYTEDILSAGPAFGIQIGQRLTIDTFMSALSGQGNTLAKFTKVIQAFASMTASGRDTNSTTNESAAGSVIGSSPAANVPQGLASEAEVVGMRSLLNRYSLGEVVGGGAWEDEAGLVLGIGAVSSEGHGWESVGHWPERAPPPTNFVGDDDTHWLDELAWEGMSTEWLTEAHWSQSLRSSRRRRRRRRRRRERKMGKLSPENSDYQDEPFMPPYVARPRMTRGGRIVIDRVPMSRSSAMYWRLALPLLSRRRKLRQRAIENWQKKIQDHIVSPGKAENAKQNSHGGDIQRYRGPTQSSSLPSTLLSPHEGDAFDQHSYHAKMFKLSTTHGPELDTPRNGITQRRSHIQMTTRSSYLAHSRFQPASLASAMIESVADSVNVKADRFDDDVPSSTVDPRQREIVRCGFARSPQRSKRKDDEKKRKRKPLRNVCDVYEKDEGIGQGMDGVTSGFGSSVDVGFGHWFQTTSKRPVEFSSQTSHSGILRDPPMSKGVSRKKLEEIYSMADSDDEDLLAPAFHNTPFAPRSRALK